MSIVRPFNTFGPRQSARAVIPTIIVQMLKQDTVQLGALHPTRDFTYVTDTAAAFMAAAASPASVGQVVEPRQRPRDQHRRFGPAHRPVDRPQRRRRDRRGTGGPAASEVERLLADNRKAREVMGWTPTVSLEAGLQATIAWIAAHLDLYEAERYAI